MKRKARGKDMKERRKKQGKKDIYNKINELTISSLLTKIKNKKE
jgi:hypothetical protein